ncbi:NAD(P)H-binding protein [Polaribacter ponticola]|uniref:NAD(P)H-binding protein n=1 Tax=Polaribacter ponticola TaxID=2978475 RepID=A0ABT5S8X9_9FLAO|nr:NAD(P)H-binding protein [Polaribacter sp. MSW5]MDD7914040.1 NAD(P)H-binding protein [Polaribacter sp. MSW5]
MKKVAITLASGQLGSKVIQQLIKEIGKENVVGIARNPKKAEHLGVEIRKADYNSFDDFSNVLQNIDTLLLISGVDKPDTRTKQHQNIIKAAQKNNVKKIVFTSVIGNLENTSFKPILQSNRQTETDIINSKMDWSIGRNSLYIEPDLEYVETYKKLGVIVNSAANGKCGYTSRNELAIAYTNMLLNKKYNNKIYNLLGEPVTQQQLADSINKEYGTNISYQTISVVEFLNDRSKALGEFLGIIISSIYENIKNGSFNLKSDFETVTGRKHKNLLELIQTYKRETNGVKN